MRKIERVYSSELGSIHYYWNCIKRTDNYTLYVFHFNKRVFAVGLLFLLMYTIETRSFIINESMWDQWNAAEGFYNESKGEGNNRVL